MFERRKIKKSLEPREEFIERARAAFLAVYDRAYPEAAAAQATSMIPPRGRFGVWAKAFVAVGALIAVFAGASVYADTANVGVGSPLYPLKRLGENVQLAIAPPTEKAQLQATFADRRVAEIGDLAAHASSSPATAATIANLNKDFNIDVDNSLATAAQAKVQDGNLDRLCNTVFSAIATSSVALHDRAGISSGALLRFTQACAVTATSSVSSTVTVVVPLGDNEDRMSSRGFLNPSSTVLAATSTVDEHEEFHVRGGGVLNVVMPGDNNSWDQGSGGRHRGLRNFLGD